MQTLIPLGGTPIYNSQQMPPQSHISPPGCVGSLPSSQPYLPVPPVSNVATMPTQLPPKNNTTSGSGEFPQQMLLSSAQGPMMSNGVGIGVPLSMQQVNMPRYDVSIML
jgi:hypothetical protein